jgi:hypothetical protein
MHNTRIHILELCSEDAYNSWTFWSDQNKTEADRIAIVQTIDALVREKKLMAFEHKPDGSFVKVHFDINRLEREVRQSMVSSGGSDSIYWFSATEEGRREYEAWAKEYWTEERVAKEKERWRTWKQNKG